ncbi:MAG: VOC family protein [Rhodobacteraceae bacterium]|nr:VOC family protein [Paracoccaceae bacterium]
MNLTSACPILPSSDLAATHSFWARLGFNTLSTYPEYMILAREGVELHFFAAPNHTPEACYAGAYLRLNDPSALDAEWGSLGLPETGIPRLLRIEDKPWGMRELAVLDPDGNLIRLGAPL